MRLPLTTVPNDLECYNRRGKQPPSAVIRGLYSLLIEPGQTRQGKS